MLLRVGLVLIDEFLCNLCIFMWIKLYFLKYFLARKRAAEAIPEMGFKLLRLTELRSDPREKVEF